MSAGGRTQRTQSQFTVRTGYEAKAPFLETVAFELVKAHTTEVPMTKVEAIVTSLSLPEGVLREIYASEMVRVVAGNLSFMHQSFQEYYASEHFLRGNPDNVALDQAVLEVSFHDMLEILVGFAGTRPDVVRYVINAARHADATLAARCLRLAECCERELLEQFVGALVEVRNRPPRWRR